MVSVQRHHVFAADGPVRLLVDNASGRIEVRASVRAGADITVDAADPDGVDVSQYGDLIEVRRRTRRGRVTVVALVPEGSDVEVTTASADTRLVGRLGEVRTRSSSGDVDVDQAESVDARASSGDITVMATVGDLSASTSSGDVEARSIGGKLVASLSSGDVTVHHAAGDVEAASTSGDIEVRRCDGGDISLRCVSGNVVVGLPTGIRVEPDLSTISGTTRLPAPAPSAPLTTDRRRVRLRVKTVSGDITVVRA
jgi:DUF4097 and DUF4098 domain-containing protein YvlB